MNFYVTPITFNSLFAHYFILLFLVAMGKTGEYLGVIWECLHCPNSLEIESVIGKIGQLYIGVIGLFMN